MSQGGILSDKTSAAANIEFLTGDVGGAVGPDAAFNINLLTGAGLTTTGVPASNTITWTLDNYSNQTATTSDAVPNVTMTIPLGAVAGVYTVDVNVSAYNVTDSAAAGFSLFGTVKTNGAVGTLVGLPDKIVNNEVAMATSDANIIVSGNNMVIQVTGIAAKVINWRAITFYTFIS
jgi:alkaline phosphatase